MQGRKVFGVHSLTICLGGCGGRDVLTPFFGFLRIMFSLVIPVIVTRVVSMNVTGRSGGCVIREFFVLVLVTTLNLTDDVATRFFTTGTDINFTAGLERTICSRMRRLSFARLSALKASALVAELASSVGRIRGKLGVKLHLLLQDPFVMLKSVIVTFAVSFGYTLIFTITVPFLFLIIFIVVFFDVPLFGGMRKGLSAMAKLAERGLANIHIVHTFYHRGRTITRFSAHGRRLAGLGLFMKGLSTLLGPIACMLVGVTAIVLVRGTKMRMGLNNVRRKRIITLCGCVTRVVIRLVGLTSLVVALGGSTTDTKHITSVLGIGSAVSCPSSSACSTRVSGSLTATATSTSLSRGTVMFGSMAFRCDGTNTPDLSRVDFSMGGKRAMNVVNNAKDKGAALMGLVSEFCSTDGKAILLSNRGVRGCAEDSLHSEVNIIPRGTTLFGNSVQSGLG